MINKSIKGLGASLMMIAVVSAMALSSCSNSQSYSNLLNDEEKATNWWLSNQKIELVIPSDSVFQCGEDAPFYKMDNDGYIYMQVINPGTDRKVECPKTGDTVYFRFLRTNIKYLYEGYDVTPEGNGGANSGQIGPYSFVFGNYSLSTSSQFGSGIQLPLTYLGYNSEVNLVLRSYYGFSTDQSQCNPYLINIKYFKAEY